MDEKKKIYCLFNYFEIDKKLSKILLKNKAPIYTLKSLLNIKR